MDCCLPSNSAMMPTVRLEVLGSVDPTYLSGLGVSLRDQAGNVISLLTLGKKHTKDFAQNALNFTAKCMKCFGGRKMCCYNMPIMTCGLVLCKSGMSIYVLVCKVQNICVNISAFGSILQTMYVPTGIESITERQCIRWIPVVYQTWHASFLTIPYIPSIVSTEVAITHKTAATFWLCLARLWYY